MPENNNWEHNLPVYSHENFSLYTPKLQHFDPPPPISTPGQSEAKCLHKMETFVKVPEISMQTFKALQQTINKHAIIPAQNSS